MSILQLLLLIKYTNLLYFLPQHIQNYNLVHCQNTSKQINFLQYLKLKWLIKQNNGRWGDIPKNWFLTQHWCFHQKPMFSNIPSEGKYWYFIKDEPKKQKKSNRFFPQKKFFCAQKGLFKMKKDMVLSDNKERNFFCMEY